MTLAEILPSIQQLPVQDKIKLIRILAEDLDAKEEIAPLQSNKVYYVATPHNSFGAGRKLMDALEMDKSDDK